MRHDPVTVHRQATTASTQGRFAAAARLLRRGLGSPDLDPDLRVRMTISLAWAESELAGLQTGLALLDTVRADLGPAGHPVPIDLRTDPPVRTDLPAPATRRVDLSHPAIGVQLPTVGVWHGQRGLMLLRAGRVEDAGPHLDLAARYLEPEDPHLTAVLTNRGVAALRRTDIDSAERDFTATLEAASRRSDPVGEAKAVGNLGYLAFLRGDLPSALRLTGQAQQVLAPQSRWFAGVAARGRADVLIAAGLLGEAEAEYRQAVGNLAAPGHRQDRAEAELGLAEIARLRGRYGQARTWARRAHRHFAARGAPGWALLAELEIAWVETLSRPGRGLELVTDLEPRLRTQGLREEAIVARLLHIGCLLRTGQTAAALRLAGSTALRGTATRMATTMLGHEARAGVAAAAGDHRRAQRARTRGLADLHAYQARFGSVDMVTATTRIGGTLAQDGLGQAIREGRPAAIFGWSEQVRATASRIPSVRPPMDPHTAQLLARLRIVTAAQRSEQLSTGRRDPQLLSQARALQAEIRQHAWQQAGTSTVHRPVRLSQVRTELGSGGLLLSLMTVRGDLSVLAVTARAALHIRLGDSARVRELVLRLRADLDQLARQSLPTALRPRVLASMRRQLQRLDTGLAAAVGRIDPGGPVVIVPSGQSALVPWTLLPRFAGRQVCVVPSATWWVGQRRRAPLQVTGREVHVAGPDVDRAVPEVFGCADGGRETTVLTGAAATVGATLAAMDGAAVLHVAAHGRHEPDNPLFSSVLLADGWLYGHDLDAVAALPAHVVLSACETGMASIRPGDEALGMTAALLHGGSRSVIASVAKVGDQTAEQTAIGHHDGLRRGLAPARALAEAIAALPGDAPAPTVCFGLGW